MLIITYEPPNTPDCIRQINDGRVIKMLFKERDGSVLRIGQKEYAPVEAIFHSPSEHTMNGKRFDIEMQIRHKDSVGNMVRHKTLFYCSALMHVVSSGWRIRNDASV